MDSPKIFPQKPGISIGFRRGTIRFTGPALLGHKSPLAATGGVAQVVLGAELLEALL